MTDTTHTTPPQPVPETREQDKREQWAREWRDEVRDYARQKGEFGRFEEEEF